MSKTFCQREKLTFFNFFTPSFPFIEAPSNYQHGHLTVLSQAQDPCPHKPQWRTEDGYKLTKPTLWRRFISSDELVGINFNTTTKRGMIDLDFPTSKYHAAINPEAYQDVLDLLEEIGITRTVPIKSSHSGGLNIYFAFPEAVNTFALSCLLHLAFESAGFEIKPGQLEIFPNCKYFGSSYKSHCVPFQEGRGSLLLGDDLEPISARLEDFLTRLEWSAQGQDMKQVKTEAKIARKIITTRRQIKYNSNTKARSKLITWQKDWSAIIGEGWLDTGESNYLLGIIAAYGVVFLGLEGIELIDYIVAKAKAAPGYRQYCNHQHEIRKRASEWARTAQRRYWKLGTERKNQRITFKEMVDIAGTPPSNPTNDKRAAQAQGRIQIGWEHIEKYALKIPQKLGEYRAYLIELIEKLTGKRISNNTLTKYPTLWHPKHNVEVREYFSRQKDLTDLPSPIKEDREKVEQPEPDNQTNQTEPEINMAIAWGWGVQAPETSSGDSPSQAACEAACLAINIYPLENSQTIDISSFDHTNNLKTPPKNSQTIDISSFDHTPSYMKVFDSQPEILVNNSPSSFDWHQSNNLSQNQKKNKNSKNSQNSNSNPAERYYQELLERHDQTWGSFAQEKSNPEYQTSLKQTFAQIREILTQRNRKPRET